MNGLLERLPTLDEIQTERRRRQATKLAQIDVLGEPVRWVKEVLACTKVYPKQAEMIEAVRDYDQVSTAGCNSSGKDYMAAHIALWWITAWRQKDESAKVVITAPSDRQISQVVFQDLRAAYLRANQDLGGKLYEVPHVRWNEETFIFGFATDKPYKLQGFHSPHLLVIVSEAHGVAQSHMDVLYRLNPNRMLLTGNPISESGEFYDSHHGKSHLWHTIDIDAFDTPNVIEGREVVPGLVTIEDIERHRRNWGEDSPLYKMTVLNEWVEGMGQKIVVPLSWAKTAEGAHFEPGPVEVVGCDVARGGQDQTAIYSRRGRVVRLLYRINGQDTMATADYLHEYHKVHPHAHIVVDGVGIGAGVVDRLRQMGVGCIDFQGGAGASDSARFFNATAEVWWRMREGYARGLDVEPDDELRGQVSSRRYEIKADRRIKLESKEDMRADGRRSPDSGDALSMTFYLDWQIDGERLSAGSDVELHSNGHDAELENVERPSLALGRGSDMAPYHASRWGGIRKGHRR